MKSSNKRILTIGTVIFSLVIGLALANYTNAQNRPSGGRAKSSAKASKTTGKRQPVKKNKKGDKNADDKPKIVTINLDDTTIKGPFSVTASEFGITPPIRDLPEVRDGLPPFKGEIKIESKNNEVEVDRVIPGAGAGEYLFEDPLAQISRETNPQLNIMPAPALTFNGILGSDQYATFGSFSIPPDTVGDVGPNHYVQATNFGVFRVFNKATGDPLTATARISTLFSGLSANNPCRLDDRGDPIVNYDPLADRWLVSQFMIGSEPNGQCIAVSVTGDPTGAWYAYFFPLPNTNFPDYPHWSVWTDGYYLATNDFNANRTAYVGGSFWAFDRSKMLVGDPTASYIRFERGASFGHLPADVDGYMPPAAGTPGMFFEALSDEFGGNTDSIVSYELVPNYATPANSTLTVKPAVAVAALDPRHPSGRTDIEQPPPAVAANNLDSIGGQLMYRVGYRNLGTILNPVNSYVMNLTVNVSGENPTSAATYQAAPRWTEMRRNSVGVMSVFDQGTHAPDAASGTGRNRWMGSIAQDYLGNLALGFSRSGPGAGQFPDIVWAGRTGGQTAAGEMNEGEATMFASTGVQQGSFSSVRWGDYSSMTVDPADDCTFWYTQEYRDAAFNGQATINVIRWSTRIGKFKFPSCNSQPKGQIAANVTFCGSGLPINNTKITATAGNFFRLTNASGNLVSNIIAAPGAYTVTAGKDGFTSASTSVDVTDGNTTTINVCLNGNNVDSTTATITSESCAVNNAADPGETLTVNLGLRNVEGSNTTNLTATLLTTGGVIAASRTQNYGVLTAGGAAVNRSFTFTVDPNVIPGSSITLTLALSDGATDLGTATYTIPVGTVLGAVQNFNYAGAVAPIPDGDTAIGVNTTINVSGVTGAIQDLNFIITGTAATPADLTGIDHSYIGDLEVYLTSPAGTRVLLVDSINSATTILGTCSSNNIFNTTLDDAAATSIDLACPGGQSAGPLTGTFKPQNPLSAFNTQNPNGTWTLNVRDTDFEDTGSVRAYRLAITPGTAACQSKVWTGAVSSDWNNANNWSPAGVPFAADSVVIPATGATNNPTISAANVTVANLTVVSPRVLTVNAGRTLNVTGTALINGTLTITGTALLGASPGLTGSNVIFNGSSAQTIPALPYNNLTINNPAGTTLGGATTVNGILTLTNGIVNTGANTLTLANCATAAISGGSAASHIRGALSRCAGSLGTYNYPVGTATGYSPLTANITALATNPSSLTVRPNDGTATATPPLTDATTLNRYWSLTETGDLTASLTFNYLQTDVDGNEGRYGIIRVEGGTATQFPNGTPCPGVGSPCVDPGANTMFISGVSNFSDWTARESIPTAASVPVSGRVLTSKGRGITNAVVTMIDSNGNTRTAISSTFGYFRFTEVPAGETYVFNIAAKRFTFAQSSVVLNVNSQIEDLNFTAQ